MDKKNGVKLQVIGLQGVFINDHELNDKLNSFIFGFMARVNEINYGFKIARLIRYEKCTSSNEFFEFIGIEVENITSIPVGMIAWVLKEDCWDILTPENRENKIVSQYEINWRWIAQSDNNGYISYVGDFYLRNEKNNALEQYDYCLITNAYYDFTREFENGDKVEIQEYDLAWKEQYSQFEGWILENFGFDIALHIEHIGSTSIPGMPSKPSIDVAVEVPSFLEARRRIIPLLNNERWEYWWFSQSTDVMFYKREQFMGKRTHYIHLAPCNHELWNRIAFRDYLKSHPEDAIRYADLKRNIANSSGGEWMSYTNAKSDFVNEITEKALRGQN